MIPWMRVLLWLAAAVAVIAPLLAGCGAQRRGEPEAPAVRPDGPVELRGAVLFHRFCYQCHPGGEAGLGPGLNDKPVPDIAVRAQIRKGVGAMPSFDDETLPDRDVGAILAYMHEMRSGPARYQLRNTQGSTVVSYLAWPSTILSTTALLSALRPASIVMFPVTPSKFFVCARASRMGFGAICGARFIASASTIAAS